MVTLVANTVATVSVAGDWPWLRIIPLTVTDPVFMSLDGSTAPTVAGDGFVCAPLGAQTTVKQIYQSGATVIKLISAGSGTVIVEGCVDSDDDEGLLRREGLFPQAVMSPGLSWLYSGVLTTSASTAMRAAGAGQVRNYVTGFQFTNTSATATLVNILDGASVVWQGNAPASMTVPVVVSFPTPLRGTAATAMNVQCGTAAANVLVNAQGYQSV